jgi:hypothetical protein
MGSRTDRVGIQQKGMLRVKDATVAFWGSEWRDVVACALLDDFSVYSCADDRAVSCFTSAIARASDGRRERPKGCGRRACTCRSWWSEGLVERVCSPRACEPHSPPRHPVRSCGTLVE